MVTIARIIANTTFEFLVKSSPSAMCGSLEGKSFRQW